MRSEYNIFLTTITIIEAKRKSGTKEDLTNERVVGKRTCIGAGCIILKGTIIGENCVIGVGSVVKGVIPDNSVVIQKRTEEIYELRDR